MKRNITTACRVMSSQVEIVKEIKSMLLEGYGFNDLVKKYLPEYISDEGCILLVEHARTLKKKKWSSVFDATVRLPDRHIDEIITILFELDRKNNPSLAAPKSKAGGIAKTSKIEVWQAKLKALNSAIQEINMSKLDESSKQQIIKEFKRSIKLE